MPFTKADLIARSGLPDRTIRNYQALGIIPRAEGHGLGACYGEEHMLRAVAIGRMRAEGLAIGDIVERIAGWSTRKFRSYVASTEPKADPAVPEAQPAASPVDGARSHAVAPGAPAGRAAAPAVPPGPQAVRFEDEEPIADLALPPGATLRVIPLLPGLVLMIDGSAPRVVQRIAAEICGKYGARGG